MTQTEFKDPANILEICQDIERVARARFPDFDLAVHYHKQEPGVYCEHHVVFVFEGERGFVVDIDVNEPEINLYSKLRIVDHWGDVATETSTDLETWESVEMAVIEEIQGDCD